MGWFSPIKGSYPSLAQVDKTLPVKSDATAIVRGSILALDGEGTEGVWKLANNTDKLFYVALQDYNDPTAGYAGTAHGDRAGTPRITALSLDMAGEYETSEYDATKTYTVGGALTVSGGKLTPASEEGNNAVVGYVTLVPTSRWINNAISLPSGGTDQRLATRTGAQKRVIRFRTAK